MSLPRPQAEHTIYALQGNRQPKEVGLLVAVGGWLRTVEGWVRATTGFDHDIMALRELQRQRRAQDGWG
jgi:hypothetical protein